MKSLVGRAPFAGGSLPETLLRLTSPEPVELGPLAGTALAPVLARGLAKNPDQRFESAARFRDALRGALTGGFQPEAETPVRSPPEASSGAASLTGSVGAAHHDRFDPALLARLRADLVQQIGPIADTLLRRAAAGAETPQDLLSACVGMIEDLHERAAFLRRNRALVAAGTGSGLGSRVPAIATTTFAPDASALASVEAALAFHLGPIARVLVRKEAGVAGSAQNLVERLAAHVEAEADAARFRRAAQMALGER